MPNDNDDSDMEEEDKDEDDYLGIGNNIWKSLSADLRA